jgi:putative MATE family efflux protein
VERAKQYATQALLFSLIFGAAVGAGGVLFGKRFFQWMGNPPEVAALGYRYLSALSIFLPFLFGAETAASIFRASGDTRTPMLVTGSALIFNIVLNPFLIFGLGPFPRLEMAGAGLSTGISYTAELLTFLAIIKKKRPPFAPSLSARVRPDYRIIAEIAKIGLPVSISGISFTIVYLFLDNLASSFGVFALAALGFGNRIEAVSFLTCFAFSVAAATLVGQYLGAKNPEAAEKAAYRTTFYASIVTGTLALIFLFLASPIVKLFSADPAVIAAAVAYLRIIALSQVFMGFEIVLEGAFSGAGNTLPAMLISVPGSLARIPLAYFFARTLGWGVPGIWWAITLTTVVRGAIIFYWFSRGNWKKKKVAGLSAD